MTLTRLARSTSAAVVAGVAAVASYSHMRNLAAEVERWLQGGAE